MLRKTFLVLASAIVVQLAIPSDVLAQRASPVGPSSMKQYFLWNSGYGGPLLSPDPFCGDTNANQDKRAQSFSVHRDLEEGVNLRVGMSRNDRAHISATLLFVYNDDKLSVTPENIELHVQGNNAYYKPIRIERETYIPKNLECKQLGEWVQLEFPLELDNVSSAELRFPPGTVVKRDVLNVSPFGFKRVQADASNQLDGTWIVDAKATEERLVSAPRPPNADKLAQWFGLAGGYMSLFTYEFKNDSVVVSAYRGNKVSEYQKISEQGAETKYTLKGAPEIQANTLSVSVLADKSIRINHSNSPEMGYLSWKRGQLKTETATVDDVMAASHVWMESVQRIVVALSKLPNASISKDASR